MGVVVDSSSLVAAERGEVDLAALLAASDEVPVVIAAITASELLVGVRRMAGVRQARAEMFVEALLARVPVVEFDLDVARVHAALAADLRTRGQTIGAHDLQIGATAVFLGYQVATRDLRSFPKDQGPGHHALVAPDLIGPYDGPRTTAPALMTSLTARSVEMSCVGSPCTATRSADSPAVTRPTCASRPRTLASIEVAERSAATGVMPYATISSSSRAFSPCGKTPTSEPEAMSRRRPSRA